MAEIEETQRRIALALSRIDAGVEALQSQGGGGVPPEEFEAAQTALEEERRVTAELQAQMSALKADHAAELDAARSAAVPPDIAAMDAELQQLKTTIQQLRQTNTSLREAHEAGVADPQLINQSMAAELTALRAERAAEVAETTAILAALEPLVTGQTEGV